MVKAESVKLLDYPYQDIYHVFNEKTSNSIKASLSTSRPLLITGEPGIGKSQLAKAAAVSLKRNFVSFTVDSKTESRDLLWQFDAIARLASAQVYQALKDKQVFSDASPLVNKDDMLAEENFINPGPLWWAFNWDSAVKYAKCRGKAPPLQSDGCVPKNGTVVLVDEIDKADSDVPNGLLEALGNLSFQVQGANKLIKCESIQPLVIITSNQERPLPDAFIRRCLSLHLRFPDKERKRHEEDEDGAVEFLVKRAVANQKAYPDLNASIFEEAAEILWEDREAARSKGLSPLPGQAEYFDLLRGVQNLSQETQQSPKELIQMLREFTFQKHPEHHKSRG